MNLDDFPQGSFQVWQPDAVELRKSDSEALPRIAGLASTSHLDRQQEEVFQKGLDFKEFEAHGWFNDNHKQETAAAIGIPDRTGGAKLTQKGWYVQGTLLKTPRAQEVYHLAKALQSTDRRLGFSIEGKILERVGNRISKALIRNVAITSCPVNVACFPAGTDVLGSGGKVFKRHYTGLMVQIDLADGKRLTGTPNHPVLTQVGWVALGDLVKGRHRVGTFAGNSSARLGPHVAHDVKNVPSRIEQVHRLASVVGPTQRLGATRKQDFHGDGGGGQVDIVTVHGQLERGMDAAFAQHFGSAPFLASDLGQRGLSADGQLRRFGIAPDASSGRMMRCGSVNVPLDVGEAGGAQLGSLSAVADLESSFADHVGDSFVADAEAKAYGECARALAISFHDIIDKRCFKFSGHVYNLETKESWYLANGVVAHNCSWDLISKSWATDLDMKAMDVGYQYPPSSGAGVLVPESLEGGELRVVYECPSCKKAFQNEGSLDAHINRHHLTHAPSDPKRTYKSLYSLSDAISHIERRHPEWSSDQCMAVARHCWRNYPTSDIDS